MRPLPAEIGPYRIVRELGQGGAGVVYEGRHADLARPVAVKVLHTALDPTATLRFQREAELLGRVRHPNVVVVHGVGRCADGPWLACDLVPGRGLDEVVAGGGLPWRRAVEVARGVASGVAALHALGLVHRDIKPANVLLRDDGVPVLLDFGLAREVDGRSLTQSGILVGTPAFMPPEQVESPRVDARADVYSLAATLLALITGRAPFDGSSAANILVRVLRDPPDLSGLPSDAPHALRDLLRRSLGKSPDERPASAAVFAAGLEQALAAPAPSRIRAPIISAAIGVAAMVAAMVAFASGVMSPRPEPPPPAPSPPSPPPVIRAAPAVIDPLVTLTSPPPPGLARLAAWRAGWAALGGPALEPRRRAQVRACMEQLQSVPLVVIRSDRPDVRVWAAPLDARRALVLDAQGAAGRALDLETGELTAWLPASGPPGRAAMCAAVARGPGGTVAALAITPDSRTTGGQERLRLAPLAGPGAPADVAVMGRGATQLLTLAASADGRLIAAGGTASEVVLVDVAQGRVVRRLPTPRSTLESPTRALAFASDGSWLAVGGGDSGDRSGQAGWLTIHALAGSAKPLESPGLPTVVMSLAAGRGPAFALGGMRFLMIGDARTAEVASATDTFAPPPYGSDYVFDMDVGARTVWTTTHRTMLLPWRWDGELAVPAVPARRRERDGSEVAALRCTPDGALVLVSVGGPARIEVWGGELPD